MTVCSSTIGLVSSELEAWFWTTLVQFILFSDAETTLSLARACGQP